MKCIVSVLVTTISFSLSAQYPSWKHDIKLDKNQSFKKIPLAQMIDSVNGLQAEKQFEFFEIELKQYGEYEVDEFMKSCKSIQSIFDKFGKTVVDMAITPLDKDKINTISGFYYSFSKSGGMMHNKRPALTVIYPRSDKMME